MFGLLSLFRSARTGTVPEVWDRALESEGIIHVIEDVPTTITFRNYRRPGKWCSWNRKLGFLSALVITRERFIAFQNGRKQLDLPFSSELWSAVSIALRNATSLQVIADASAFRDTHRGQVEFWFETALAPALVNELTKFNSIEGLKA